MPFTAPVLTMFPEAFPGPLGVSLIGDVRGYGAGGWLPELLGLGATLAVLALARRTATRPNRARATLCPSTPMITGSLEAMIRMKEASQSEPRRPTAGADVA